MQFRIGSGNNDDPSLLTPIGDRTFDLIRYLLLGMNQNQICTSLLISGGPGQGLGFIQASVQGLSPSDD